MRFRVTEVNTASKGTDRSEARHLPLKPRCLTTDKLREI